ncbi:MAG TPA: endo-1,4-beta-xylanase [Roseiarcus sp.]|nr:endo-1,4-beta-xylanase [Roseiarcus sp.]
MRGRAAAVLIPATVLAALGGGRATAEGPTPGSAAAASGRYFGAALDAGALDERPYRDLVQSQLTSVTPENAMKWGTIEPLRGQFDWAAADALVAFAKANSQKIRGHTLVWHSQLPPWLIGGAFAPAEIKELMVAHIAAEAGRYRGSIYAWDVVNEAFADDGSWRPSIFYDAMGPDYVAIAFAAARQADPDAKLYVNDYNVETDGAKMRALYGLVSKLKREGVPIDGVGLQSHFVLGSVPADLSAVMRAFASLGVDVAVTELDIRIRLPASAADVERQAEEYAFVVDACRAARRCVGVTTWGLTDDRSWVPSVFAGYGAALPFDPDGRPKPAAEAMAQAFAGRRGQ